MLNHGRTLLANLKDLGNPEELIAPGYTSIALPQNLEYIHNALFAGTDYSRRYKLLLTTGYLNIIEGALLTSHIEKFDNRISYDLNNDDYFRIARISAPTATDSRFVLRVTGSFNSEPKYNYFDDEFIITQTSPTSDYVRVYSTAKQKYIKGSNEYSTITGVEQIEITFTSDQLSNLVPVGATGLYFQLYKNHLVTLSISVINPPRTWTFSATGPFAVDFFGVYNTLHALKPFTLLTGANVENYKSIWDSNTNIVQKIAAVLLAYITKVDELL